MSCRPTGTPSCRLCLVLLAATALGGAPVSAQDPLAGARARDAAPVAAPPAPDTSTRIVRGRVVRPGPGGSDLVPVPAAWVTLHRVGADSSGPLDSMRTRRDGGYSFRYHLSGSPQSVYFVSVSYSGIAYFSAPLREERVIGEDAEVTVFDTTSGPVPLHVRGRHIVVSSPGVDGMREIVEVYEISNDTIVTRVSPDDSHPTWSTIIPAAAEGFQLAQSDISPGSIRADSGMVTSVAPFAPGLKQISFAYQLPESAFPLAVPLSDSVPVLEVLLEEPGAKVSGARLASVGPVSIEGRTFNRFLAQDAPRNAVVEIDAPPAGAMPIDKHFLIVLAAAISLLMLGSLTVVLSRQRAADGGYGDRAGDRHPSPPPSPGLWPAARDGEEASRLARAIAELDAGFERSGNGTPEASEAYRARRAELKRQLTAELDARRSRA